MKKNREKKIIVRASDDELNVLKKLSNQIRTPLSKLVRYFIENGLKEFDEQIYYEYECNKLAKKIINDRRERK